MDRADRDCSADERGQRDIEIIDRNAECLNREAMDTPWDAAKYPSRHA
jgi:hypothetical protein